MINEDPLHDPIPGLKARVHVAGTQSRARFYTAVDITTNTSSMGPHRFYISEVLLGYWG